MNEQEPRFSGLRRLFGAAGLERLRRAHVCVVGIGGVGSWAVEALARSAVGGLTLVDPDDVCVSNVNRQLHALDGAIGRPKVEVMAERVRLINPDCAVQGVREFFTDGNAAQILAPRFHFVIDAIDSPTKKAYLIARCGERDIPVITIGAAAGRRDPTAVRVIDLAFCSHDRLFSYVRRLLRRHHDFPRGEEPFGVDCVFSPEPAVYPQKDGSVRGRRDPEAEVPPDCEHGLGTATYVTGTFGFAAAGVVVRKLADATAAN